MRISDWSSDVCSSDLSTAETRLSARGLAFNIPSWKVDGMDPLAVHLAMQEALAWMRAGKGPAVLEADVYRSFHKHGPSPGSAFGYATKAEKQEWRARYPPALLAGRRQAHALTTGNADEAHAHSTKDSQCTS